MLDPFANSPLITLVISLIGAVLTWFVIDHFRTYVLGGNRDPLQISALRYMQIAVGLLTICLLGVVLSSLNLIKGGIEKNAAVTTTPQENPGGAPDPGTQTAGVTPQPEQNTATPVPTAVPSPTPGTPATIANTGGAGVNLRSLPGLNGTIITSVDEGARVQIIDEPQEADGYTWRRVLLGDGLQGWVVADFLIISP